MLRNILILALAAAGIATAGSGVMVSSYAKKDFPLSANPADRNWKHAPAVFTDTNSFGKPEPGLKTEIRSRWTDNKLYLLFICPYDALYMKPEFDTKTETNKLWEWDVAEAFIGDDPQKIHLYKEFEISPQGEWVDLDIDFKNPKMTEGIKWDSGFQLKTRIDKDKKIWYGEMQIPFKAISKAPPKNGLELRANFYRMQGPDRKKIAWQPTNSPSFHVPSAFGTLKLEGGK